MGHLKKIILLILLLTFGINSYALVKKPYGAELLNASAYGIDLSEFVFMTSSYVDFYGNKISVPSDASYVFSDTDFKLSYGMSAKFELNVGAKFRYVKAQSGVNNPSNSGPESAGLGFKYRFDPIDNKLYAIGLHFRQTLYSTTKYTTVASIPQDEVILGDDGSEYGVDFYNTIYSGKNRYDLMLGYNVPPNYLSQEILYKAEINHYFSKLSFQLGLDGIYSLKKDPYSSAPTTKPQMSTGPTYLYNSVNREKMEIYTGLNYDFKKFSIGMKGGAVVTGYSTDKGYFGIVNLSWFSEGISPDILKVESFKEYSIEGAVLKVSARGNFVKIDQGLSTDVEKGMAFDIYQTDYFGGNILVGSGYVQDIGADWSVIKMVKKYNEIEIKPGFAARGH
jgi:hypothetical protein